MRYLLITLLLTVMAGNNALFAQSNKERERDVKISGKFYYGEGLDKTLKASRQNAFNDLKLMITEDAMRNNLEFKGIDFEDIEDDLETIVFELEGRVKVLMFLSKDDVKFKTDGNSKVFVIKSSDDGVNVIPVDDTTQETTPASPTTTSTKEPTIITISNGNPTTSPVSRQTQNNEVSNQRATPPPARPTSQNDSADRRREPIIDRILPIKEYEEVRQILNSNKANGKLMYGQIATLSNAQRCFFLVLKDKMVIDVLDRGEGVNRRSLVTGNIVDYRSTPGVVLWVNIL